MNIQPYLLAQGLLFAKKPVAGENFKIEANRVAVQDSEHWRKSPRGSRD